MWDEFLGLFLVLLKYIVGLKLAAHLLLLDSTLLVRHHADGLAIEGGGELALVDGLGKFVHKNIA